MKIRVMNGFDALLFEPEVFTYALRLTSNINALPKLKKSVFYKVIRVYEFDDATPRDAAYNLYFQYKLLDDETASQMIKDFKSKMNECIELLVHCSAGKGRSPAVAKALDEIFDLGSEIKAENYPHMNMYVYYKLKMAAMNFKP